MYCISHVRFLRRSQRRFKREVRYDHPRHGCARALKLPMERVHNSHVAAMTPMQFAMALNCCRMSWRLFCIYFTLPQRKKSRTLRSGECGAHRNELSALWDQLVFELESHSYATVSRVVCDNAPPHWSQTFCLYCFVLSHDLTRSAAQSTFLTPLPADFFPDCVSWNLKPF